MDGLVFVLRYGFLVGRFRSRTWWFEAAIMVRKLLVVLAFTLFASDESKAASALVAIVGCTWHVCFTLPYTLRFHNGLAIVVLTGVAGTLAGATFEDETTRYAFVGLGIGIICLGIVAGNAIDVWVLITERRGGKAWLGETAEAMMEEDGDEGGVDDEMSRMSMASDTSLDLGSLGLMTSVEGGGEVSSVEPLSITPSV